MDTVLGYSFLIGYLLVIGACVGSFLNVLIDRLPNDESPFIGRSHCDHCKKTLRWWELVPLLSFIYLGGRCGRCHKRLSWQYPLIELITGLSLVVALGISPNLVVATLVVILVCCGIVLLMADLKYMILPDSMVVLAGIVSFFLVSALRGNMWVHLSTGLVAGSFFLLLWLITKKRGIGFGDVKLSLVIGFLLGYPLGIYALYLSFVSGALVGIVLLLRQQKTLKSAIPFGPFLLLSTVVVAWWSHWFLQLRLLP